MIYEESSFRAIYNYKLLCKIKDQNDKSLCEAADQSMLTNIVKDVFLDSPSSCKYNFNHNPPILDGQNGVPLIVDELLGKSSLQPIQFPISYKRLMYKNQVTRVFLIFLEGSKRNGYFVEIGGHDGEEYSNTLFFEINRNYSGKVFKHIL